MRECLIKLLFWRNAFYVHTPHIHIVKGSKTESKVTEEKFRFRQIATLPGIIL